MDRELPQRLSHFHRIAALAVLLAGSACSELDAPVARAPRSSLPRDRLVAAATTPTAADAVAISARIRRLHVPYGTVVDPRFASADSSITGFTQLVGYARAGDSAIWTGHYLAAEAFRYAVTHSRAALASVRAEVNAVQSLIDVTGTDVLARVLVPTSAVFAPSITGDAGPGDLYTGSIKGQSYYWIGNTSRDQYTGVMFGLAVTYDLVPDRAVRAVVRRTVTRLLTFLISHGWNVVMPDGKVSTTFLQRPEIQLSFLQVGRHVNPVAFAALYAAERGGMAATVSLPIQAECQDTYGSYYKFNLDYANLYDLVRLETDDIATRALYVNAYETLRGCTATHENAHFNMVDRALTGPSVERDAATIDYLDRWLERARRDYYVDLRNQYPACGENRACSPIPVEQRPNTDFLWQRSPLLLYGGGEGTVETAGIDFILPYWMARFYGVLAS